MEHIFLKDLILNGSMQGTYILQNCQNKVACTGSPYISGTLMDTSSTTSFIMFDYDGSITAADVGRAVNVAGDVEFYNGRQQVKLYHIELAKSSRVDWSTLVPTAPIDVDAAMRYLNDYFVNEKFADVDYHNICLSVCLEFKDFLRVCPAAMSVHHAFLGGLLMHTVSMMQLANKICDQYESMGFHIINRDLLVAGAMLHDIGKIIEFDRSEQGLVTDYSKKGQLMGHAVIGAEIVDRVGHSEGADEEKIDALKHLVLSHHGKAELGAAMAPKCIEAELLSMIDNMDSRVEIYRESLEYIQPGSFGDYNKYLTKRIYKVA